MNVEAEISLAGMALFYSGLCSYWPVTAGRSARRFARLAGLAGDADEVAWIRKRLVGLRPAAFAATVLIVVPAALWLGDSAPRGGGLPAEISGIRFFAVFALVLAVYTACQGWRIARVRDPARPAAASAAGTSPGGVMAIWAGRSAVLLPLIAAVLVRDSPPSGLRAVIWQLLGAVAATALSVLATERLQARIHAGGTAAQSPQRRVADAVLRSEIASQASLLPLAVALTATVLAATRAIDSLGFDGAATAFDTLMLLILLPLPFISYSAARQRRQIRQSLTAI